MRWKLWGGWVAWASGVLSVLVVGAWVMSLWRGFLLIKVMEGRGFSASLFEGELILIKFREQGSGSSFETWLVDGPKCMWWFEFHGGTHPTAVIPLWSVVAGLLVAPGFRVWRMMRQRRRARLGLCSACGYDRGGSSGVCPECGAA